MNGECSTHGRDEIICRGSTEFGLENLKQKNHLGIRGVNGRLILKIIVKK
jgi:hypothetical protein